jgi:AraC-like DNA-binding protein
MAASVHADLKDHTFVDSVRGQIRGLLPTGNFGIESVASVLYMTPRTLQRRLREEGTTFRGLVDAARKSIVLECVERRQAPDEIIRHAGYTNPRSFRRALRRWNL